MCRAEVDAPAAGPLAALLRSIAFSLAEREGADPATVRIGPDDHKECERRP